MSEYDNNYDQKNSDNENEVESQFEQGSVNQEAEDTKVENQSSAYSQQSSAYSQQSSAYSQQPPAYSQQQYNSGTRRYYGQNSQQPYNAAGNSSKYVYYGNNNYQNNYNPMQGQTQSPYNYSQPNAYNQPFNSYNKPNNGNKKGKKIFFACIIIVALTSLVIAFVSAGSKISKKENTTEKVDGPKLEASDSQEASFVSESGALTAAGVYDKVKESSVGVLVYSSNAKVAAGEGSGVIVGEDKEGKYTYIITCAHVIENYNIVRVQLFDETQCEATVIGSDAKTDIAVLRIAKTGLKAFEIGDADKLVVGETVYAIGNPGGVDFAGSFTNGMISAIARPISSEIGYQMVCLQHTAAINPGNSGGALVNEKGQLVGINSSKIASTEYEGMGFSVPSTTFVKVYNEIIEHGYVTNRPKLGITYVPATASETYSMLVGVKNLPAGSIVIQSINVDSSLVGKGVEVGDIITKVNGEELENSDSLPKLIENSKVGDKLTLTICHFDKNYQMTEFDVEIVLVEDKGTTENIEEATTTPYYWNPFGSYFGE